MIAVIRFQKPAILHQKEQAWLNALNQAITMVENLKAANPKQPAQIKTAEAEKERASNKYRHDQVKTSLDNMFHGKCAYCESKIKHVSDPHIEHFRPKSKPQFRHLTFDWDNLLLACGVCNSSYKGDKFPEAADGGPYINPCTDNPNDHFEFVYDVKAKLASVYGKTVRGTTTEKELGLNRPELRIVRSQRVQMLVCIAQMAQINQEARQILAEAKKANAEYSAFAQKL